MSITQSEKHLSVVRLWLLSFSQRTIAASPVETDSSGITCCLIWAKKEHFLEIFSKESFLIIISSFKIIFVLDIKAASINKKPLKRVIQMCVCKASNSKIALDTTNIIINNIIKTIISTPEEQIQGDHKEIDSEIWIQSLVYIDWSLWNVHQNVSNKISYSKSLTYSKDFKVFILQPL